ncbi:hypothetical protein C4D60_Mb03t15430 [Musa balbisiana]|uniref:Uncharacterized protein n=1 Tax=Musa balbisiana TaxID=52838 RepID=A0A4S8JA60_MUSBA|nr:hypothetical protein C4D60_Mb03t15430 [Musa balbisiana]
MDPQTTHQQSTLSQQVKGQPSKDIIDKINRGLRQRTFEAWNLPSAFQQQGAMFIIPSQLGRFDEVFMRWESITKNLVSLQGFTDPQSKMEFIENLLGESKKLAWIQWRMAYPDEYQLLLANADGAGDPFQGSTGAQEEAYRDLEGYHAII